jgi:hypothetical protein
MYRLLTTRRLTTLFVVLFALSLAGVFLVQRIWVDPGTRCERAGGWWDIERRNCAQTISNAENTGRPNGVSPAEASKANNRELVEIEHRLRAAQAARAADTERQSRALAAAEGR